MPTDCARRNCACRSASARRKPPRTPLAARTRPGLHHWAHARSHLDLRRSPELRAPLFTISRGGQATYHGPGQLVGYPILDLTLRGRDLHRHLRVLEDLLITALARCGVTAGRREGLTGVGAEDRKIASIGVGVRRWVSFHGFALNVTRESLPPFADITPCGLGGVVMTALEVEAGRAWTVRDFAGVAGEVFQRGAGDCRTASGLMRCALQRCHSLL